MVICLKLTPAVASGLIIHEIEYIMKNHFGAILLILLLLAGCNSSSAVQEDPYIVIKTGQAVNPTPDIPMKGICIFGGQAEVF